MARPKKEVSEENIERFQRELELAGDKVDVLLQDKKGRSRSCLLCRRRKQRCDHKMPSCTACLKAAVRCVQPERYALGSNTKSPESTPLDGNDTSSPMTDASGNDISRSRTPMTNNSPSPSDCNIMNATATSNNNNGNNNKQGVKKAKSNNLKSNKSNNNKGNGDEYTSFLEKKLKYLEKMINLPPTNSSYKRMKTQYKKISHLLGEIGDLEKSINTLQNQASIMKPSIIKPQPTVMGGVIPSPRITSSYSNAPSPSSNSPSILLPLPDNNQPRFVPLNRSYQQNMGTPYQINKYDSNNEHNNIIKNGISSIVSHPFDSIDFTKCIFSKYNLKEFYSYDPAFDFDEKLSRTFLDIFFTRLQFKYPLLDENEIYEFHDRYIRNDVYSLSEIDFHFACGRMWLAFSISACLHMTTGKYRGLPPERYFSTAIRHITLCGSNLNYVQQVEILTLLVLYILRTDRDSLVLYEIIKDVMMIAKNHLNLNRLQPNDPFGNKKLRLFWCIYLLERMICVAVGRPYTISESEIDLPLFSIDSFNTSNVNDKVGKTHGVHFINQSLKLRRLESQFVEDLKIIPQRNNSNEFLQKQLPLVKKYFYDLELWRSTCSKVYVRNFENETLKLYYYRSVRLLIQPYLEMLTPEDKLFRECQAAAGQICQLYKIFHQKTVNGHSTPAVHTVFVAGVTLVYCMWLARNHDDERRRKLGDESKHTRPLVSASLFSTLDDLRACSVSLYVMTERSNFARTFRDTFDQLMNATIGNLIERCGPDSSELIYISSGDVDVILSNDENGQIKRIENSNSVNNNIIASKKSETDGKNAENNNGIVNNNDNNSNNIKKNSNIDIMNPSNADSNHKAISNSTDNSNVASSDANLRDLSLPPKEEKHDKGKKRNGMPPAINRRFGSRQSEEHVGFVEGALIQDDAEEQRELKKRRMVLGKSSIPASLSHLLDMGEDSTVSGGTTGATPITSTISASSETSSSNIAEETQQYIVKKPVTSTEFDWQSKFEQQAFLQQRFAQQNLQLYLSTLGNNSNNNNNNNNNSNGQSNNNTNTGNGGVFAPGMSSSEAIRRISSNVSISNCYSPPAIRNLTANGSLPPVDGGGAGFVSDPATTGNMTTLPVAGGNLVNSTNMIVNGSTGLGSRNSIISNSGSSNFGVSIGLVGNSNTGMNGVVEPNINNSSDILLSSGTHDMINNISTWTTDSVNNLLNSKINYPIGETDSSSTNIGGGANNPSIGSQSEGYIPQDAAAAMHLQQEDRSAEPTGHNHHHQSTHTPFQYQQQNHASTALGLATSQSQTAAISSSSVDNGGVYHSYHHPSGITNSSNATPNGLGIGGGSNSNNNNARFSTGGASWDSYTLAQGEDFWTVNDDYGFLT
ncbi:hypothetical protein Kpol_345p3 [Vanderwaltozyma polyspora DSM 70294]|uniref:Zn(2)-C6 fungal-type domain-containing protein n=1 Tax=Vanderwaltozyma polyspora (strain ATCC 22028 / DSM 70294 / BCRC 21397 / CBS 2163 / NBRC 10782 / NRRL Y-8283 / UCD 57-17) TaxID=436907 RepID=A7TS98_VANPO|nr:uncharacterized protein Kpol_345p3 [Vanderwaltozyma polyspora DSM 70294]EDO14855.1 hypothetical protein Kpol_345p3 [Vanderwaltozyma polyspora DSM 70294]